MSIVPAILTGAILLHALPGMLARCCGTRRRVAAGRYHYGGKTGLGVIHTSVEPTTNAC
jgi:hypothetical protein